MYYKQEFFDAAVAHFLIMKKRSTLYRYNMNTGEWSDMCVYQAKDGGRCIIGQFIPDGHKILQWTGALLDLMPCFPDLRGIAWPADEPLLACDIQLAHDNPEHWDDSGFVGWHYLAHIAKRYRLNFILTDLMKMKGTLEQGEDMNVYDAELV